ncbi:MAG: hypothetical protein J1F32_05645 [Erysipelotrichales bacterium]|nr:hypothetical protein [Erysipelotrichales bacterium]
MNIEVESGLSNKKIMTLPGSKSITIRALFCAFLANSTSKIINPSICEDTLATIKALKKLGGQIVQKENEIIVKKRKIINKDKFAIDAKSSATLLRFVIPLFLLVYPNKELTILMNDDLSVRPLDGFDKLVKDNNIYFQKEKNKLIIKGEISSNEIFIDGSKSSQFISGVLLALPIRPIDTTLHLENFQNSYGYIHMTLELMKYFNANASLEFVKGNQEYQGRELIVESDYSNAALFFAIALHKDKTLFEKVEINSLQPDKIIIDILKNAGAKIAINNDILEINKSELKGFELDLNNCIDLAPILFALASQAKNKSVFSGFKRLEYKESNRLLEMLKIFDILQIKYDLFEDYLTIYPSSISYDGLINCPKDHRIIHALIYLASVCENKMELANIEPIFKSDLNILKNLEPLIDIKSNKPQILISIKSFEDLKLNADGYVMGYKKFTLFASNYFTFEEIKRASKDKKIFVLLNALIHQNKLEEFKKEVDKLCNLNVSFIVQDVGALHYLEQKISHNRIVFNPYTLICQQDELNAYSLNSNATIGISNEITLSDTYKTLKKGNGFLLAFGYAPMYQSYRKVLSLYEQYIMRTYSKNNLFLKEDTRNEFYHVSENKYGTVIFRPYILSYLENISYILNAKFLFLDSNFVEVNKFKKVLDLVHKLLLGKMSEENAKEYLNKLKLNIEDGFKYQDSIYKEKTL